MQYETLIETFKSYVDDHVSQNLSVDSIAHHLGYSARQLTRILVMKTGISPREYLRWTRLCKAVFAIKYSQAALVDISLQYGYESQEGFTRAFKECFGVNPGDYRKSEALIKTDNWHINQMLQQMSHDAADNGIFSIQNVDSWMIHKPARIWAVARRNHENLPPNEFYKLCAMEGIMDKTGSLPDVLIEGGAILTMEHENNQLCFGVELETDYPVELLKEFEIFYIPELPYVVFNCPPYAKENHGSVIHSIWEAQKAYQPERHQLEWNYGEAPIIECDNDELGYTMWFPTKMIMTPISKEVIK